MSETFEEVGGTCEEGFGFANVFNREAALNQVISGTHQAHASSEIVELGNIALFICTEDIREFHCRA